MARPEDRIEDNVAFPVKGAATIIADETGLVKLDIRRYDISVENGKTIQHYAVEAESIVAQGKNGETTFGYKDKEGHRHFVQMSNNAQVKFVTPAGETLLELDTSKGLDAMKQNLEATKATIVGRVAKALNGRGPIADADRQHFHIDTDITEKGIIADRKAPARELSATESFSKDIDKTLGVLRRAGSFGAVSPADKEALETLLTHTHDAAAKVFRADGSVDKAALKSFNDSLDETKIFIDQKKPRAVPGSVHDPMIKEVDKMREQGEKQTAGHPLSALVDPSKYKGIAAAQHHELPGDNHAAPLNTDGMKTDPTRSQV